MGIDVSVPCARCENALRYGERRCSKCGEKASRDLIRIVATLALSDRPLKL
jgi:predicted amidophosphoribosyltransferase